MPIVNFELKTYPDIDKAKKQPNRARAYIAVLGQLTKEVDGEEFIAVSAKCHTCKEVNENVNELIKELKKKKKRAKDFFEEVR